MAMSTTARGLKRPATDALEGEQRLAKRFNLLNIDSNGKLYIPVAASSPASAAPLDPSQHPLRSSGPAPSGDGDDWMELEDTKDKVYIYDLDKELAELESDEENPIFLPDIEKHLTRVPKHVLLGPGRELERTADNQLVLYGAPTSLTVPEEKDSVRRAIIEARQRAGAKSAPQQDRAAGSHLQQSPGGRVTPDVDETMHAPIYGNLATDDMEVEPMEVE